MRIKSSSVFEKIRFDLLSFEDGVLHASFNIGCQSFRSSFFNTYSVVPMNANTSIAATKIMRLGPAGFTGTSAPLMMVKAGVRS